jgi:hypothetical protein
MAVGALKRMDTTIPTNPCTKSIVTDMALFQKKKKQVPEEYRAHFRDHVAMYNQHELIDPEVINEKYDDYCRIYHLLTATRPCWDNSPQDIMYLHERSIDSLKVGAFLGKLQLEYDKKTSWSLKKN